MHNFAGVGAELVTNTALNEDKQAHVVVSLCRSFTPAVLSLPVLLFSFSPLQAM